MFHYSFNSYMTGSFLCLFIISHLNVFSRVFILLIWKYHFFFKVSQFQYPRHHSCHIKYYLLTLTLIFPTCRPTLLKCLQTPFMTLTQFFLYHIFILLELIYIACSASIQYASINGSLI